VSLVPFLTSGEARAALAALEADPVDDVVRLVSLLRRSFDRDQAAALAELHRGRTSAQRKFGERAATMLYTLEALEQATPAAVADHRARRFPSDGVVADLGCGIGGDAMSLPGIVVGVDLDPLRLAMARHNVGARFIPVRADVATLPAMAVSAVFADPARRDASGRRVFDVERYSPPLSRLTSAWLPAAMAVKVHPGIDHSTIPPGSEAEFVSLDGDMRECVLWFGDLRVGSEVTATLLPSGAAITGRPSQVGLQAGRVGGWLHEPDPAVLRAGLVGDLAATMGLSGIDPTIAYLTGDDHVVSPFLTSYRVESVMGFNAKKIRSHLRALGVGEVVVKKRGSAVDPDAFRKSLGLSGSGRRVVVLTRQLGEPVAVICH
jgi:SAM-dependent methyltransferase